MGFNPIKKIRKLMNRSFLARRASDRFLSKKKFRLGQQEYSYVVHSHNYTWTNERAVEISIAKNWVDTHPGQRTLEVGNVYRHYFDSSHLVIDK